jgi:hypothetical protein
LTSFHRRQLARQPEEYPFLILVDGLARPGIADPIFTEYYYDEKQLKNQDEILTKLRFLRGVGL